MGIDRSEQKMAKDLMDDFESKSMFDDVGKKTVMDAVNHYKAEHPEKYDIGFIFCDSQIFKAEFNTLVDECVANFGRCSISFSEHCSNESARLQEDNKIDWSQAPEGCVGYSVSTASNHYWMFSCHQVPAPDFGFTEFKFHPKPQPKESNMKPVFTQEMSDNGELPPIGSKAQFVGNDDYLVEFSIVDGDEIECICHTKDFEGESIGVYRHKDGYSVSILTQLIKPIDTRTEKEKAIDYMKYAYAKGNSMEDVFTEITKGYVNGVTWSGNNE